jgi:predicted transcriptional regulator
MAASPIKVDAEVKEQVRLAAALLDCSQAELVGRAVAEYTARHASDLRAGVAKASAALSLGDEAAIAYLAGEDTETLKRVGGHRPAS